MLWRMRVLFLGNHSAMDLMADGKIPAFAQTKGNAGGKKPTDAANQSVAERRQSSMPQWKPRKPIFVPKRSINQPKKSSRSRRRTGRPS